MFYFFFNDTATTEIYTLSLHDALPISRTFPHQVGEDVPDPGARDREIDLEGREGAARHLRSEEHTSELQSRQYLVCRLLLEKKKDTTKYKLIGSRVSTLGIHVSLTFTR